mgnify:CR=1 FL=1
MAAAKSVPYKKLHNMRVRGRLIITMLPIMAEKRGKRLFKTRVCLPFRHGQLQQPPERVADVLLPEGDVDDIPGQEHLGHLMVVPGKVFVIEVHELALAQGCTSPSQTDRCKGGHLYTDPFHRNAQHTPGGGPGQGILFPIRPLRIRPARPGSGAWQRGLGPAADRADPRAGAGTRSWMGNTIPSGAHSDASHPGGNMERPCGTAWCGILPASWP